MLEGVPEAGSFQTDEMMVPLAHFFSHSKCSQFGWQDMFLVTVIERMVLVL